MVKSSEDSVIVVITPTDNVIEGPAIKTNLIKLKDYSELTIFKYIKGIALL